MKFPVKGHGLLEVEGLTQGGVPALRLVAYHCPDMTVNAHNGVGFLRVKLSDIDFRAEREVMLPPPILNHDRAQLGRLQEVQEREDSKE